MSWNKQADWIPYFNALEWVLFWKDDLMKAQRSLLTLEQMGVPTSDKGYIMSVKEVETSKKGLQDARFKLARSFRRLTNSDKNTWKLPSQ